MKKQMEETTETTISVSYLTSDYEPGLTPFYATSHGPTGPATHAAPETGISECMDAVSSDPDPVYAVVRPRPKSPEQNVEVLENSLYVVESSHTDYCLVRKVDDSGCKSKCQNSTGDNGDGLPESEKFEGMQNQRGRRIPELANPENFPESTSNSMNTEDVEVLENHLYHENENSN